MPAHARRLIDTFLAGDASAAAGLLSPDACFHSPVRDYFGADQIESVWHAVSGVVHNPQAESIYEHDDETLAFFSGTIKAQPIAGVVRTLSDESGRVADITLMIRPWAALKAGIADIGL